MARRKGIEVIRISLEEHPDDVLASNILAKIRKQEHVLKAWIDGKVLMIRCNVGCRRNSVRDNFVAERRKVFVDYVKCLKEQYERGKFAAAG